MTAWKCLDGNEAAARVAYRLSDVCAIYPITPASSMGELADTWSARGDVNIWGSVPHVVEMQSEAGAAGSLHGALQLGSLATTFTASQGLLLMLPNMYKIAGELTPAVMHVAARAIATHGLSIFGDHSDVMSARGTGWAMLCSATVQEAQDLALVAHASTLRARIPFVHFFDGFRTSHEVARIAALADDDLRALMRADDVRAHRERALSPERPVMRGTAQNPDVFFQGREASNAFYEAVPAIVQEAMDELAARVGREYRIVDYVGSPDAERVVVVMGSAAGAVGEAVDALVASGERVGALIVRLYRPFPVEALQAALPASATRIAVLDRCKEPGAPAEPLHLDVSMSLAGRPVSIVGGRYGLASKEFTAQDAAAVFAELARQSPRREFTCGIVDDVTGLSLEPVPLPALQADDVTSTAVFYGLGSDGTVGANKASIKIIGESAGLWVQGYFVYDSKKSGSVTTSHLRYGPEPIRSTYLVSQADFVGVHQFGLLARMDLLSRAAPGATVLLNAPYAHDEVWDHLPREVQQQILGKGLRVHSIDAYRVAREAGLGGRINTVMQAGFFALTDVVDLALALEEMKGSVSATYGRRGRTVVERNHAAIDAAVGALGEIRLGTHADSAERWQPPVPVGAPAFVQEVTGTMLAGRGDELPVSALPVDGTFPTATAAWEKRALAASIPIWQPDLCIDCGKCAIVCPHAAIRMKAYGPEHLASAPEGFASKDFRSKELPTGTRLTIQVAPDDCTGCGICVEVCPARSKSESKVKAINLEPVEAHRHAERRNFDYFLRLPETDRALVRHDTVKGSQLLQPLFEFSGACSGCGETPYLKLLTQLFGDRMVVANATGCSSIYGGNLPTTPWSQDAHGRGPAWSNSLFEDNAEFGLGMRLALDQKAATARRLLGELAGDLGPEIAGALTAEPPSAVDEAGVLRARLHVEALRRRLHELDTEQARELLSIADALVPQSVWIVGGDGWAYDIGFGGLDHVLSSGRNVNVLVLDTEVYSNTGGQASKSTPRAATAKFASDGKRTRKKDLGLLAQAYGDVYVAQVAMGANETQVVRAMLEAAAHEGPSIVIAYSTCIAHGIEMSTSMEHQKAAVSTGYWPLYRYHPAPEPGTHPFSLDSAAPTRPVREFLASETRFSVLERIDPERADELQALAQADIDERWHFYEQLAGVEREIPHVGEPIAEMAQSVEEPA